MPKIRDLGYGGNRALRLARLCVPVWTCALLGACTLGASSPAALASDLPPAVVGMIETKLPGYESPQATQRDGQHIGWGDFDANGMDDVALLLRGRDDWQLVVFRQLEEESYQADVIDQFPGDDQVFKRDFPLDGLELEAVAPGAALELDGTAVDDAAEDAASLALRLPATERTALLFKWDAAQQLFGTTRLRY